MPGVVVSILAPVFAWIGLTLKEAGDATEPDENATNEDNGKLRQEVQEQHGQRAEKAEEDAKKKNDNATKEDNEKLRQQVQEQRQRAEKAEQDAKKKIAAADQLRLNAETAKAQAEEVARVAEQGRLRAEAARQEAEERWRAGIRPVFMPSEEALATTKGRVEYKEGYFHVAVAGVSGSGKSSLLNAFRRLGARDPGAASVGAIETTLEMARYPDPNPNFRILWYDVPGAGTFRCPDWQYFNSQGLYVFDCIIVLIDNRFMMTDIAILTHAKLFQLPTYIVRSKADQHIRNIMRDTGDGYETARMQYMDVTRRSIERNLREANLPDQRVYIVSNSTLLSVMRKEVPDAETTMDEVDLVRDLMNEAYMRRGAVPVYEAV